MTSVVLDPQQLCDLEMLLNGSFFPLEGFLNQGDYDSVVEKMHLASGALWPMPIVLAVPVELVGKLEMDSCLTLKDEDGTPVAGLTVASLWQPDRLKECESVFGSTDRNHPYIDRILSWPEGTHYVGGRVQRINGGVYHFDFPDLRLTPAQSRAYFEEAGWKNVVGFQTRNPMHRSHYELTLHALREAGEDAHLLLQPVVGITQPCDVDYHTRVRCYKHLLSEYPEGKAKLCVIPLSMRMAGPREAVWHALIRKNYGCTHFVVGRDHAGPSYKTKAGKDFYGPYDAQQLVLENEERIGLKIIVSKNIVYCPEYDQYFAQDQVPEGAKILSISGTEQRRLLQTGENIPQWFSFPKVIKELRKTFVPKHKRGLCLYLIGLSGAGKSTISKALLNYFLSSDDSRQVSVLDGDVIRRNLSKGLGFSKEDRSTNVQRIGFVASEIAKHRGIVICANIAPYEEDRAVNRQLVESKGGSYVEIWVKASVEECQRRDVKGLYATQAGMTGVGSPFEEPASCNLIVNTEAQTVAESVCCILQHLQEQQLIQQ